MSGERFGRVTTWRDHVVGLGLGVAYVALLLGTANTIGLARDEGIYVQAAERYAGWLSLLARAPGEALTRNAIDSAFAFNHEHPPLLKLLFGLGHLTQRNLHPFTTDSLAFRFAGMLSAGVLLWVIYLFGTRLYGARAGLFAALIYALLPRPFYHAHLLAFDVPITCVMTASVYTYYRSLESPRGFGPLCGLVFGLALLTKHNSWFLPIMFGVHFTFCGLLEWRSRRRSGERRLTLVPSALLWMALLGPLVFFGGWPWLWHDTLPRLKAYAAFHMHHEYYNMEYFGVNYFWPPFPSSYAWVMTLFTVPLTTLVLGVGGAGRALAVLRRSLFPAADGGNTQYDPTQPSLLVIGVLLTPLLAISLPSTPIFGGTKHWFSAYPMLALLAGRAFEELCHLLPQLKSRLQPLWALGLGGLLLAPAAVETAHSHPFALSHYTAAAGGVPGAAEKGMNRQFWGFTTRSLVPFLRQALPNGGTLYVCDTIGSAFQMLIRDGHLPASFHITGDIARADFALVHHEKHFAEVDHQIWTTYGSVQPAHVLLYDGVPIISVYENPRAPSRRTGTR
ncbi:MAG: glycosyltransferase family 39 protein [Polyangiales bacterium]